MGGRVGGSLRGKVSKCQKEKRSRREEEKREVKKRRRDRGKKEKGKKHSREEEKGRRERDVWMLSSQEKQETRRSSSFEAWCGAR